MPPYIAKSKTDSYSTPTDLYKRLDDEFNFDDFDPCPLNDKPTFDGLKIDWKPSTFVNPPYSRLQSTKKYGIGWVEKAHLECLKGNLVVMLIPSRTDTKWFHEIIQRHSYEIRFLKGRLKFSNLKTAAPFPSMIVIFKPHSLVANRR
mgnify:CR=1 FL=1|tara:strand:+ start:71 stop:511 length:441 start_codon:yes stop_codon:yes gene_type:complete